MLALAAKAGPGGMKPDGHAQGGGVKSVYRNCPELFVARWAA